MRLILIAMAALIPAATAAPAPRQMERLDRGVVAVKVPLSVYVGWRLLGTDPEGIAFDVHRLRSGSVVKVNPRPVAAATNLVDPDGRAGDRYSVRPATAGTQGPSPVAVWLQPYREIPLEIPAPGRTPDGRSFTYAANDASAGDLDGDGQYEIVLKWDPSNSQDNSKDGHTGPTILDALELDGTRLWRIDLGPNVRSGAHYLPFSVYDLDGDGRAELACRTADGTVDGVGRAIGDATARHVDKKGRILRGPEFLTVFDGRTGAAGVTVPYEPARGNVADWGDDYGNRCDRFLDCVAYLDGAHPSLVTCRGYYKGRRGGGRNVLVAWDFRGGKLSKRWTFVATGTVNPRYLGQGAHSVAVGDVDGDGKDEILYGAMAVDDDGRGLYSTGLGHGDALHLGDLDPGRPGLELFMPHEEKDAPGVSFREAGTGKILWKHPMSGDVGRGVAADIVAEHPGAECWAARGLGLYSCKGAKIGPMPKSMNFLVWWDADPLREILDRTWIAKYEFPGGTLKRLLIAEGCESNNGTKATPCLSADLFGDWREEVVWRTADNKALRIYTTVIPADRRLVTLMHDPVYRLGVARQNAGYNQPPHTGFFLGHGMPSPPRARIVAPAVR
jgi:rhamnogalacturonan endolyase